MHKILQNLLKAYCLHEQELQSQLAQQRELFQQQLAELSRRKDTGRADERRSALALTTEINKVCDCRLWRTNMRFRTALRFLAIDCNFLSL